MITEINESKTLNVNLMEENIFQINGGITINVNVSIKNILSVKKNYIWNPATNSCKLENI